MLGIPSYRRRGLLDLLMGVRVLLCYFIARLLLNRLKDSYQRWRLRQSPL